MLLKCYPSIVAKMRKIDRLWLFQGFGLGKLVFSCWY